MVVVSEFVGCSPSVSGAIRVNPWSIDSVADGIYTAIQMPAGDRHLRHEKHWRYISGHTVGYWAQVLTLMCVSCSVLNLCRWSASAQQMLIINSASPHSIA
jgi:trehalose-6-phosphate synthase